MNHLIITVHGIRTNGDWQERLHNLTRENIPETPPEHMRIKYGFFSFLQYLIPPLRWIKVWLFCREVKDRLALKQWERIDIVGHSFGTYVLAYGLRKLARTGVVFQVNTVILAGSVLRDNFPWQPLLNSCVRRVVNECGSKDNVLLINQLLVPFAGAAGRFGFSGGMGANFTNREYCFGHSGYFAKSADLGFSDDDAFMRERWLPLLTGNDPLPVIVPRVITAKEGVREFIFRNMEPVKLTVWVAPFVIVGYTLYAQNKQNGELLKEQIQLTRNAQESLADVLQKQAMSHIASEELDYALGTLAAAIRISPELKESYITAHYVMGLFRSRAIVPVAEGVLRREPKSIMWTSAREPISPSITEQVYTRLSRITGNNYDGDAEPGVYDLGIVPRTIRDQNESFFSGWSPSFNSAAIDLAGKFVALGGGRVRGGAHEINRPGFLHFGFVEGLKSENLEFPELAKVGTPYTVYFTDIADDLSRVLSVSGDHLGAEGLVQMWGLKYAGPEEEKFSRNAKQSKYWSLEPICLPFARNQMPSVGVTVGSHHVVLGWESDSYAEAETNELRLSLWRMIDATPHGVRPSALPEHVTLQDSHEYEIPLPSAGASLRFSNARFQIQDALSLAPRGTGFSLGEYSHYSFYFICADGAVVLLGFATAHNSSSYNMWFQAFSARTGAPVIPRQDWQVNRGDADSLPIFHFDGKTITAMTEGLYQTPVKLHLVGDSPSKSAFADILETISGIRANSYGGLERLSNQQRITSGIMVEAE